MAKAYRVSLEIEGPLGMFSRPDTGILPVSYPVPTWSASKAILESIAFFSDGAAYFHPTRVEICRRLDGTDGVRHYNLTTNYRGPYRKSEQRKKGSSFQHRALVVVSPCYRIWAEVRGRRRRGRVNPRRHLKAQFNRRLRTGRCHTVPVLGWSDFPATYWGPIREGVTEVDRSVDLEVPAFLNRMWDAPVEGEYAPRFTPDARVEAGVLTYAD